MRKFLLAGSVGVLLAVVGVFGTGHAQEFRHGDNATIGIQEKIDSSVYLSGRHIDAAGTINGDLFCAGQNVTISGTINGDLICAAQNITVTGTINGSARLAAQTVNISSEVQRNLTVFAQDLTLDSRSKVGGDITGGINKANINGTVGRDLVAGASELTVDGHVGRNVTSAVDHLTLGGNAKIGGGIYYTSNNAVVKEQGSTVSGVIERHAPEKHRGHRASMLGFNLFVLLSLLIMAVVLALLFPAVFERAADFGLRSLGKTLLAGIIATLLTPIIIVILMITIIGIPLGILLLMLWITALFIILAGWSGGRKAGHS
jgi:uncharacterized protein YsxB (DUF464 family)